MYTLEMRKTGQGAKSQNLYYNENIPITLEKHLGPQKWYEHLTLNSDTLIGHCHISPSQEYNFIVRFSTTTLVTAL